ncbi:MAG: 4'-phosphopantetheinyl transferase superfamily protein [Steroidobacteraceae bacterium]
MNGPVAIQDGEIHLWQVPLGNLRLRAAADVLDEAERRRAQGFRFAQDRDRFIAAHVALRHLLGHAAGVPAASLAIAARADGKPHLTALAGLAFNLSHSEELALIGVARSNPRSVELGVDVERIRPLVQRSAAPETEEDLALAQRHFTPHEIDHLRSFAAGPRRTQAFFQCWTRKESCVKATGTGIGVDLREWQAGFEGVVQAGPLWLSSVTLDPSLAQEGYVAAVAATAAPHRLVLHPPGEPLPGIGR